MARPKRTSSPSSTVGELSPGQKFGQFLKHARQAAGLTQEQLAAHVGKEQWAISQWERGRAMQMPTPGQMRELLAVVDADPKEALQYMGYLEVDRWDGWKPGAAPVGDVFLKIAREVNLADGLSDDVREFLLKAVAFGQHQTEMERCPKAMTQDMQVDSKRNVTATEHLPWE